MKVMGRDGLAYTFIVSQQPIRQKEIFVFKAIRNSSVWWSDFLFCFMVISNHAIFYVEGISGVKLYSIGTHEFAERNYYKFTARVFVWGIVGNGRECLCCNFT